jgi:hypothetical protein
MVNMVIISTTISAASTIHDTCLEEVFRIKSLHTVVSSSGKRDDELGAHLAAPIT